MSESKFLNILGFCPQTLNILLELANESLGTRKFRVFLNVLPENPHYYVAQEYYEVSFFNYAGTGHNNPKIVLDQNDKFLLGVVGIKSKESVYNYFKNILSIKDEQYINLHHPNSYISNSADLDYGIHMGIFSTINVLTKIGFGVTIKNNCYIGHHVKIGNFATVNPGVTLSSLVEIGHNTLIGSGAIIRDGIKIGANCIIGMGSNVVKDIPDNSIAYGNPCIIQGKN